MKDEQAKVFIFGPWVEKKEDGSMEMGENGKKVADWMRDDNIEFTPEIAKLLKTELKAEKDFRELLVFELNQIRGQYLNEANKAISKLIKPYRTIVEAYNVGMKMGEHQAGVTLAQQLSDLMDKMHLMQIVDKNG